MSEENDSLLKSMRGHREDAVVAFKKFTEHKMNIRIMHFAFTKARMLNTIIRESKCSLDKSILHIKQETKKRFYILWK